ncbi:MAG: hypothetical protein JXA06_04540 [Bacteroidetes bacterium]|nr:hypothetical protein [Bacteroidota bacterium]
MRTFLLVLFVSTLFIAIGFSQEKIDVIYLNNGDVRKGTIIENVPNDFIKIETNDGSIYTIKYSEIKKMSKETKAVRTYSEVPQVGLMARNRDIGITAAYWLAGEVTVGGSYADKEGGLLLRAFYDEYIMPKLGVGFFVNFSPVTYEGSGVDITMIEFGGAIKPRFPLADGKAVLKIGLNIGYRMESSDFERLDKVDALGINLSVEVQFKTESSIAPFAEIGFLSQPVGGNEYYDIQSPPIIYLGGGVAF